MSCYYDTLQGDGLARAQRALEILERDPVRLDRERQRFGRSPPYTSILSGMPTRIASPDPPSEEQQVQLGPEAMASNPDKQFSAQISEEEERVCNADLNRTYPIDPYTIARENVKKRWVEQGIWNNKWNQFAHGRWKHEEPLELESESETGSETESTPPFPYFLKQAQPKSRGPKSDGEKRQMAERRIVREREREASRPYHQFVYQISKERERIQKESGNGEDAGSADINTKAYENTKNTWTKRGIWNESWGILPGMLWKHEEPFGEEVIFASAPVPANGAPPTNISERDIFMKTPSPVEPNHSQSFGAMNAFQQGLSADIDSAGSENGNTERSPLAPNSSRLRTGKRVLHTTGQTSLASRKKPSHKEGLWQPTASAALGPVHSSKVSKAAIKKKPRPQRGLNISPKVSSDSLPLDAAEPQPSPDRIIPRRSKRVQLPAPSVAIDPTGTASTDPSTRVVQSKPKRNTSSNPATKSSANPQDMSKRPSAKTTRGKAREE